MYIPTTLILSWWELSKCLSPPLTCDQSFFLSITPLAVRYLYTRHRRAKATIWYKGHATKTVGPTSYLLSRFSLLNYAPHLEVAEYRDINQKKANKLSLFIYFFVSFLVLLFNIYVISLPFFDLVHEKLLWLSVDWPTTGILTSPSLLDTLVQSCGYPFHLQISLSRNS